MTGQEIRIMQRGLIVDFLNECDFTGRVLDFGCGAEPYRGIVELRGGEYHGYNRAIYPGGPRVDIGPDEPLAEQWDVILSTQSTQYYPDVAAMLADFRLSADKLVLTYATNWPEVEVEDLWRFTRAGMERLLARTGWNRIEHRQLGSIPFGDREVCALGYGVVAV